MNLKSKIQNLKNQESSEPSSVEVTRNPGNPDNPDQISRDSIQREKGKKGKRVKFAEESVQKLKTAVRREGAVLRVVRASAKLAERITDDDRQAAKRVITEAMNAELRFYDHDQKKLSISPDHKTRLAAATLLLAYDEGKPVERSVTLTGKFDSAEELLDRLNGSPMAQNALAALGISVQKSPPIIDVDSPSEGEAESGRAKIERLMNIPVDCAPPAL